MELIDLIKTEDRSDRRKIAILASVSGIANAFILGVINTAAQAMTDDSVNLRYLFMFLIAMALYMYSLKWTLSVSTDLFEKIVHQIRLRLSHKIRSSELLTIETIGKETIYGRLTQETEVISQSQLILVQSMQAAVMVFFSSIYVFTLSPVAFILIVVMVLASAAYYLYKEGETFSELKSALEKELQMLGLVTHLLEGFKQVKVRKPLGDELLSEIARDSAIVRDTRIRVEGMFNEISILEQSILYLLLAAVVFVLPLFIGTHEDIVSELTASVLFLVGPLSLIVSAIPVIGKANAAAANIKDLERTLDGYRGEPIARADQAEPSFGEINFDGVRFGYRGQDNQVMFQSGPLNFTIKSGEILFIIGGNGSGKSTFLKLLTGLYQPDEGRLQIDGVTLNETNLQNYRERFSVIFGDFHLFDRLYGLDGVTRDRVLGLLKDMELMGKTDFDGSGFTELNLSTGQRKRIALLVAILEDRPIYVFDEWAADQDPHFRAHFYESILPGLARRGKTVIAVTHHDHFFHIADRVVKMDYGSLQSL